MDSENIKLLDKDPTVLNQCVEKLLSSPTFVKSHRQQVLVRFLMKETLAGNAHRLKGYTLGIEVFKKGADFDPSTDAIVRVEIGRLRAKLLEYYNSFGSEDDLIIELPRGSYILNFTARENLPTQNKTQTQMVSPWPSVVKDLPSLAVLPFVNLGEESNQNYFSDGMADSLIFEISRLSGIFVISRQSSFSYKQSSKSISDIGKELGVTYILDGSVQRSSHLLRVTVNLLEASSGGHIWAERYECELQEIFIMQDFIIKNIVKTLQIKLASNEVESFGHEGTDNINAHDALLRGIDCHWKYSPKYIAQARKHFAKAVELDPDYAAANAWLARTMLFQWIMRWDQDDGLQKSAYKFAKRAVELNQNLPYAMAIFGWACLWNKQRDNSIAACRKAVGMDPNNSEAQIFLSQCLTSAGYGEEALFYIEKAKRLNPKSSPFYEFALGQALYVLEDYESAIAAFKRGTDLNYTFPANHIYLCVTYALLGKEEELSTSRETYFSILGGDKSLLPAYSWTNDNLAATYEHLIKVAKLR